MLYYVYAPVSPPLPTCVSHATLSKVNASACPHIRLSHIHAPQYHYFAPPNLRAPLCASINFHRQKATYFQAYTLLHLSASKHLALNASVCLPVRISTLLRHVDTSPPQFRLHATKLPRLRDATPRLYVFASLLAGASARLCFSASANMRRCAAASQCLRTVLIPRLRSPRLTHFPGCHH